MSKKPPLDIDEVADNLRKRGGEAVTSFGRAALETSFGPMATLAGVALLGFAAGLAASVGAKAASQAASAGGKSDWLSTVVSEHEEIERLVDQMLAASEKDAGKRERAGAALAKLIARHAFVEEQAIYPSLLDSGAGDAARQLAGEHFDLRAKLNRLEDAAEDAEAWLAALKALGGTLKTHHRAEEDVMFPAHRSQLSAADNAKISRAMGKARAKLG
jgi:hemerythrin-like domain-containing protein